MSRPGWLELDLVVVKLGFSRRDHLAALVARLVSRGIIEPGQFSRERGETLSTGGRRRHLVFLSPEALVALSAHAATPEAAEFRREALSRLVAIPSNSLPAHVEHDEVTVLRARVDELEARVGMMERRPKQLALPFKSDLDDTRSQHIRALVDGLARLEHAADGVVRGRGLRSRDILTLLPLDDPNARPLRDAIKMLFGQGDISAHKLGLLLREARKVPELGLTVRQFTNGAARWFVAAPANRVH